MDWLSSNSTLMMERSTEHLWERQRAILNNISNVETPGYKTQYVTFEETMRENLRSAAGAARPAAAFRSALNGSRAVVHTAADESTRLDGNGVNLTEQGVELTRTVYQLQYAMSGFNSNMSILRTAIKGQ